VASNENLIESHRKGKFREDLFHRFNEFNMVVPALRDRKKDIMIFANQFLNLPIAELNKNMLAKIMMSFFRSRSAGTTMLNSLKR